MKEFIEKLIERLEELFCGEYDTEYIKKDDVIEIVNQLAEEYKDKEILNMAQVSTDYAKARLEELKRISNNGWIPCSERLPEAKKEVLIFADDNAMFVGRLMNGGFSVHDGDGWIDLKFILAWQPLPEPYKQNELVDKNFKKNLIKL